MAKRIDEADVSPKIARKIAARASGADEAIVVGNRAGVIEWANAAWTKVTGYPVDDAISKPIGWLLEEADIDASVVDFVQRHFLSGRRCEIEFAVTTPDDRPIWVHLDVEPFKDALGEISDFVAVATDITARRAGEIALESRIAEALSSSDDDAPSVAVDAERSARSDLEVERLEPTLALARIVETLDRASADRSDVDWRAVADAVRKQADEALDEQVTDSATGGFIDVNQRTQWIAAERSQTLPGSVAFDIAFSDRLPGATVDDASFDDLVRALVDSAAEAIGTEWGTISITTGLAEPGLALSSCVDPTIDRFPLTTEDPHVFLEIHDTAISLSRKACQFIATREGAGPRDVRTLELALAATRAERLGAAMRVHSVPGVGTRVLLYLPMG